MTKTLFVAPALVRPALEPHLPDWLDAKWFASKAEAMDLAPQAEIGWFDMIDKVAMGETIGQATQLKWLHSIYAGLDGIPLDQLSTQGTLVSNGSGINAVTIAEYVVMGMLVMAKGYRQVVRAQDAHEWLLDSPGKIELAGSKALLLGAGSIGGLIKTRLAAMDVAVTNVRRTPQSSDEIGPDDWRARLAEFDWILLAVPAIEDTIRMIGADELAAMKPNARIVNIARGSVIDQEALVSALNAKAIGGAFLDVTTPEPLPADHPLWSFDSVHISMHLSGRSYDQMVPRSVARFLTNLARYQKGEPLLHLIDLKRGY